MKIFLPKSVPLTKNVQSELINKYQKGGCIKSRNKAFMSVTTMIIKTVIRRVGDIINEEMVKDFICENFCIALKSLDKFNVDANVSLTTYVNKVCINETNRLCNTNYQNIIRTPVARKHNSDATVQMIKKIHNCVYETENINNYIKV